DLTPHSFQLPLPCSFLLASGLLPSYCGGCVPFSSDKGARSRQEPCGSVTTSCCILTAGFALGYSVLRSSFHPLLPAAFFAFPSLLQTGRFQSGRSLFSLFFPSSHCRPLPASAIVRSLTRSFCWGPVHASPGYFFDICRF